MLNFNTHQRLYKLEKFEKSNKKAYLAKGCEEMKTTKMLKKNYEFKQVLTRGKYYSGQYIKAFIINNNKQNNFLGLAISTEVRKS